MYEKIDVKLGMRLWRNRKRVNELPGSHLDRLIGCTMIVDTVMSSGVGVKIARGFDNGIDHPYIPGAVAGIHESFLTTEYFEIA